MDLFQSAEFSSHVEELLEEHHVPGVAVAIVQDQTIASAGYGKHALEPSQPCTADSLFDIASVSKSLTAASVGLLIADDEKFPQIQYEATMSSLLPDDFVLASKQWTDSVTLEDVLSHRTGMPSHDLSYMNNGAAKPDDARSVTRNLRNLQFAAPIRTKYIYNNMMYTAATHLVEKMTGLGFVEFLGQRFFEPLGMESSFLQPECPRGKGLKERIAVGYIWEKDSESYRPIPIIDTPEVQGASSIVTSANDYIKWVKALMNKEGPITDDVYQELLKSRTLQNPYGDDLRPFTSPAVYAAGWEIYYYRGHMVVAHEGCIPGFAAHHFFLPAFKFGAVIFANANGGDKITSILMQELIDAAIGLPEADRLDWNKVESEEGSDESMSDEGSVDEVEEVRQELCPGIKESEGQKMPLEAYAGQYWNPGYHGMTVEVKDGGLFVDATDRSMGFTLTFTHVSEQTKYIAHVRDMFEGGSAPIRAEFRFDNDKVTKMGLHLESEVDEYIWFDRAHEEESAPTATEELAPEAAEESGWIVTEESEPMATEGS
ncbi:beta-lactamase family protein [Drechmeria coniospora]|uniref:Beta-lactamase family protein n=1 Tax=Drechmeria coniospora TaxID=98403 RepID=A0A151GN69_DRECN|nr:beta-lactamase family protein [Drechmeria coniospora]KYK58481.1 beta-lactamase family protein [Drechmeria coniospora]